ncbi:protein EFR3 homolog A-like [Styela clava]
MTTCMCCPAFRPRYKRLVDNIFPTTHDGGLVRSEMEKLTYYAVSAPEKLDRIGEYLAHRLTRSISRKRDASVFIAMEALDQLLLACHAQQINSFVESFLRMVANLLESDNLDFQAVGTNSFIKFSMIEEDTASYHRRYDFFVSKFSAMCHSNLDNMRDRKKIQSHGVRGIHGVIRKTVADELQVNIWQKQHMDKIVPSLLYVMMQEQTQEPSPGRRESFAHNKDTVENIGINAGDCLRELLSRAAYGNVGSALRPALAHLDAHKKWNPVNTFAIKCFKVFMFAIQAQYTHVIVKMLLDHLDDQDIDQGKLKASMLEVLCAVVVIPSSSPIGPAVVEVFSQLSRHLRYSIESKNHKEQEIFQKAFINTIGVLCNVLPDFQKLEAMVFFVTKAKEIINKNLHIPDSSDKKHQRLLNLTLKSLYRITENYKSKNLSGLSSSLLDPLIKVSTASSPSNRLIIQNVLIRLLDREKNSDSLIVSNSISGVENMNLNITEVGVTDTDFIERKVPTLLQYIFESSCQYDNISANYVALYKCASMICISLSSPDILVDACRVMLALQNEAVGSHPSMEEQEMDGKNKTLLLNMISASMCVIAFSSKVSGFVKYVTSVMQARLKDDKLEYLDPCFTFNEEGDIIPLPSNINDNLLFSAKPIQASLNDSSMYKSERLAQTFIPTYPGEAESVQLKKSFVDADSVRIEIPGPADDQPDSDDGRVTSKMITFDYLKRKLMEPAPSPSDVEEAKRKAAHHIMTSTFEQLVSEVQSKTPSSQHLIDLINKSCSSQNENNITMLPYAMPEDCRPGSNNLVFPSICVL